MIRAGRKLCLAACAASCAWFWQEGAADLASNPYQRITERNVFHLNPPPPPPAPPTNAPPEKPSDLKLTGITSTFGVKKVHLMILPTRGSTNPPRYLSLQSETEVDNLKVLEIDDQAKTAKVKYGENELTLTFQANGLTNPVGPAMNPAGAPLVPGKPLMAGAGAPPVPSTMTSSPDALKPIPTRTLRTGSDIASATVTPNTGGTSPAWSGSPGGRMTPVNAAAAPAVTVESSAVLMELQRQVHQADIAAGRMPPLPPPPYGSGPNYPQNPGVPGL